MNSRTLTAIAVMTMLAAPAFAQDAKPAPAAPPSTVPAPAPVFYPITLSQDDVNAMTSYLGKLPYEQAAPIINFLSAREAELQRANTPAPKK